MANDLTETAVYAALQTAWLGKTYRYFPEIGSTNVELKKNSAAEADGSVYLTEFQSQGRGRLDRRWEAPAGTSLLFSILFRPNWPAQRANWLTMIAGLAAISAIAEVAHIEIKLKWPNDLMHLQNGQWHKVGGILQDGDLDENGRFRTIILGMGINVNIPHHTLPQAATQATSLLVARGQPVPRQTLLVCLLQKMEALMNTAVQGHSPQPQWKQQLINIGQPVQVTSAATTAPINGIAEDTDSWGQLLVRDEAGILHTIAAADVTLRA
jgi:BirA family transcriptional regulator, biotin operon repressor / biotin---[acetyl-CoA-carboxylase] ligase